MKIFVIGASPRSKDTPEWNADVLKLDKLMADFAGMLTKSGHQVITSSPFAGSADRSLLDGLKKLKKNARVKTKVELHFPKLPNVIAAVEQLTAGPSFTTQCFRHPAPAEETPSSISNAWLFSQLYALEQCHAVLAIGGKLGGTANLLLLLAEAKHKPVLPVPLLGGASEQCYWRNKFQLVARLGDEGAQKLESDSSVNWLSLVERLADEVPNNSTMVARSASVFFISYSRTNPEEADLVEMMLRRRNLSVFRDDRDFEPGSSIESEIRNHMHRASVFIALYSQHYACSPWCHDELKAATVLRDKGGLVLWLLTLDNTRIVLPEARNIVTVPASNRDKLERNLNEKLDRYLRPESR